MIPAVRSISQATQPGQTRERSEVRRGQAHRFGWRLAY